VKSEFHLFCLKLKNYLERLAIFEQLKVKNRIYANDHQALS
jgi:hypothetical protein